MAYPSSYRVVVHVHPPFRDLAIVCAFLVPAVAKPDWFFRVLHRPLQKQKPHKMDVSRQRKHNSSRKKGLVKLSKAVGTSRMTNDHVPISNQSPVFSTFLRKRPSFSRIELTCFAPVNTNEVRKWIWLLALMRVAIRS